MADWFRKQSWEAEDRQDFESRLARAAPEARPQYLRLQALALGAARPADALALINRALEGWPEHFEAAATLDQRGDCLMALGDYEQAIEAYRAAVVRMRGAPGVQTDAWLSCALAIADRGDRERFRLARQLLGEFRTRFADRPAIAFRVSAVDALIARGEGRDAEARALAREALARATRDGDRRLIRRLRVIAEPNPWRRWLSLGAG